MPYSLEPNRANTQLRILAGLLRRPHRLLRVRGAHLFAALIAVGDTGSGSERL